MKRPALLPAVFVVLFALFLTACGGGYSSGSGGNSSATITQVLLFPSPSISLEPGQQLLMQAQPENANGAAIFSSTITYSTNNPAVQISTNGLLCAGTWDSLTTPTTCTPVAGVTVSNSIQVNVTASAAGVTSTPTVVTIHVPISSIQITQTGTPQTCVSQGVTPTFSFTGTAYSNGVPITGAIGNFSWFSSNAGVVTVPNGGDTGTPNIATPTAIAPGQANITVNLGSVAPVLSSPFVFVTCPVTSIQLALTTPDTTTVPPEDATDFHITLGTSAATTRAITVTVKDSNGLAVANPVPSLFVTTSQASVATASTTTITGLAPGAATISASCLPDTCNIGLPNFSSSAVGGGPVYSNLVNGTVAGSAPTGIAFVTCLQGSPGCPTSSVPLVGITGSTAGAGVTLPQVPNSMVISQDGNHILLGSAGGMMNFDTATSTVLSTTTNAVGKVLGLTPNGNLAVVAHTAVPAVPGDKDETFIVSGSTVTTLVNPLGGHLGGAIAVAFSPDSRLTYVVASNSRNGGANEMWVFEAGKAIVVRPLGGAPTSVAVTPSSTFIYVARAGGLDTFESCDKAAYSGPAVAAPQHLMASPAGDIVVATNGSNVDTLVTSAGMPTGCPVTGVTPSDTSFGAFTFTDDQLLLSPDGAHAYVIGGSTILDNTVGSATQVTITPTAATTCTATNASCAGLNLSGTIYVGGTDSKLHLISTTTQAETGTVTLSFQPDLVVAKK